MLTDFGDMHVGKHIIYNRAVAITDIEESIVTISFQNIHIGEGWVIIEEFKKRTHIGIRGVVSRNFTDSCIKVPCQNTISRKTLKLRGRAV